MDALYGDPSPDPFAERDAAVDALYGDPSPDPFAERDAAVDALYGDPSPDPSRNATQQWTPCTVTRPVERGQPATVAGTPP
ncbi:hypothetical protein ACU686_43000 [Yinghuangia aomiensis]